MGVPMISAKVIVECPDLSAKKQFKKGNPLRRGRGGGLFKIGVGAPLPTMCDIFNFTRIKNFTSLFLLKLLSGIYTL